MEDPFRSKDILNLLGLVQKACSRRRNSNLLKQLNKTSKEFMAELEGDYIRRRGDRRSMHGMAARKGLETAV